MPLAEETRNTVRSYCVKDLPGDLKWHVAQFDFIDDEDLRQKLGRAFYSGRYVAKLMEALNADGDEIHAFVKFQIMQYAAIYEAVITHLLWNKYSSHEEVRNISFHKAYKKMDALGKNTMITLSGEPIYTCVLRDANTPKTSIAFKDKVDCAVRIGFVGQEYADDIKHLYWLRNLAHIETEAERQIEVEIEHSRTGYWRLKPFLEKVASTLAATKDP